MHRSIELLFQPIEDAAGATYAYEALLRLKGSDASPAPYIEFWERTGFIGNVDIAVLRTLSHTLAGSSIRPRVSVNVSVSTIEKAGAEYLAELARLVPLSAGLIVELTETFPVTDASALLRFVQACRSNGYALALDDCRPGMPYADPQFIAACRPQFVKLDGTYLQECFQAGDTAGLSAVIQAAKQAGACVIAEFIDSEAVRDFAFAAGADYVQGFQVGRPAILPSDAGAAGARRGVEKGSDHPINQQLSSR